MRIPKYRRHKARNLAVVHIDGRDRYLGKYGSDESRKAYAQLIAERFGLQLKPPAAPPKASQARPRLSEEPTVRDVIRAYRRFAESWYVRDGKPTKELVDMQYAAKPLNRMFGNLPARQFGPKRLRELQAKLVEERRLSRQVINRRINRVRRIFKWAVAEELVPPSLYEGLRAVRELVRGRTTARECEPVRPVDRRSVRLMRRKAPRPVRAMICLQMLTGMRPGEVVQMRPCDVDARGEIWVYRPPRHKNEWRGRDRVVPLGPKAQRILRLFLVRGPLDALFSPREAEEERHAKRRRERRTPMTPSQAARDRKATRRRPPRQAYDVDSYRRAIAYAIAKANRSRPEADRIENWSPLQLRHWSATNVRRKFGLEAAQLVLGHARADVTQVYAERNLELAMRIAKQQG
ncbi:MAG TPA: site-specific integrase [Pirellulaceae bacterium]|nr:site-specific integrase [Pirellulaceae bacterium]